MMLIAPIVRHAFAHPLPTEYLANTFAKPNIHVTQTSFQFSGWVRLAPKLPCKGSRSYVALGSALNFSDLPKLIFENVVGVGVSGNQISASDVNIRRSQYLTCVPAIFIVSASHHFWNYCRRTVLNSGLSKRKQYVRCKHKTTPFDKS